MLKQTGALADRLDYGALKEQLLPRVHRLCLTTTSAAVRAAALATLAALAARLDQESGNTMVATLQQAGTLYFFDD